VAFNRFSFLTHSSFICIPAINGLGHITDLQTKLRIEQTEQGRIALVGCETDKPSPSGTSAEITSLTQSVGQKYQVLQHISHRCNT
jgi:ABC-type cobalamin/Fe3+-siderophores transport system ATPase subunit